MNTDDIHGLSGAAAADAVDDVDRARFEAHLPSCSPCQDELASLQAAASALSLVSITPPPVALRAAVLRRISTERPLAPVVDEPAAPATFGERRAARAEQAKRTRVRRGRWLVGVAAAGAIIVGGVAWQPWSADQRQSSVQLTATQQVLQASDARRFEQKVGAATATVVRSVRLHQAVIVTTNMPAAPDGSVYELWLQKDKGMVKAGFIPDGPSNTILLDGDAAEAAGVGITVEPIGGSVRPTLPLLARITFA